MDSPYRSDRTPLQERREDLRLELEESERRLTGLAVETKRREDLARELRGVEAQLRRADSRRHLPRLQDVHVAAPCPASWDDMVGDETTRFCGSCAKSVYNLSAMTEHEAESFLRSTFGADTCIRFYRRADGTLLTRDCTVGVSRRRKKRIAIAVAAVGASAAAAMNLTREPQLQRAESEFLGERAPTAQERDERGRMRERDELIERQKNAVQGLRAGRSHLGAAGPQPHLHATMGCPAGDPLCSD